jgi:protein SCO1
MICWGRNRRTFRNSWTAAAVLLVSSICISLGAPRPALAQAPVGSDSDAPGTSYTAQQSGKLPDLFQGVGISQHLGAQIPLDATFRDETGKTVTLASYFGKKPVVLILAYYNCPMLCPLVLSGATTAFKDSGFELGNQFDALTVSFSPTETPKMAAAAKQDDMKRYGAGATPAAWHFLTGQQSQIERLTSAVGFHYKYNPKNGQYVHAAGIVVLTPKGRVSKYFYGVRYSARDLHLALVQSSTDHIGTLADQVLLFCCTYDPATGKYHAVITRVIDICCGITVLVIAGLLFFLFKFSDRVKQGGPPPQAA